MFQYAKLMYYDCLNCDGISDPNKWHVVADKKAYWLLYSGITYM